MELRINSPNSIILDQIDSWPASALELLQSEELTISLYLKAERLIDRKAEEDISIRIRRPLNPYKLGWENIVSKLHNIIRNHYVIGFHCSRLTEKEISDIKLNGLCPLHPIFNSNRLKKLVEMNLLTSEIAELINSKNESTAYNRKGNVCFFHCLSTLKDESGLYRLFRSWGGEAIYYHYEDNPDILNQLKNIGNPCIFVVSLNIADIDPFNPTFEGRMINIWLMQNMKNAYSQDFNTNIKNKKIPVVDAITIADSRFEILTNYSKWKRK